MVTEPPPPSVLLVEDDHNRRWLWRLAIDRDHRFGDVLEAGSTREALDLLMREYPDIVMADVDPTTAGGADLVTFLRSRHPTPIVVATSASKDHAHVGLHHGATTFWTKLEASSPKMSEHLWRLWQQDLQQGRQHRRGQERPDERSQNPRRS